MLKLFKKELKPFKREYIYLAIFALILAIVLAVFIDKLTAFSFVLGAVLSALAGYIGMMVATMSTSTAQAAEPVLISPKVAFLVELLWV